MNEEFDTYRMWSDWSFWLVIILLLDWKRVFLPPHLQVAINARVHFCFILSYTIMQQQWYFKLQSKPEVARFNFNWCLCRIGILAFTSGVVSDTLILWAGVFACQCWQLPVAHSWVCLLGQLIPGLLDSFSHWCCCIRHVHKPGWRLFRHTS